MRAKMRAVPRLLRFTLAKYDEDEAKGLREDGNISFFLRLSKRDNVFTSSCVEPEVWPNTLSFK